MRSGAPEWAPGGATPDAAEAVSPIGSTAIRDRELPPIRVLLAEDEEHLGTILETFLAGRKHDVTRVRDGAAAIRELRASAYDVALLDIVMPEMDGLEVLRALATMPSPPEAIVMTGNGTVETALTAVRLGAYDYLAKPYRMAEVELLIGQAAGKRRLRLAAACARWRGGAAPPVFLTEDAGMRSVLERGAALARTAERGERGGREERHWLVIGPPGSGRRALARWLAAQEDDRPATPLLVTLGHGPDADVAALFGLADGAGDASLGALEAAGPSPIIVDGWGLASPGVRTLVEDAVVAGGFPRGGAPDGGWVALSARLFICAAAGDPISRRVAGSARRVDLPPLDARPMDIPLLAGHLLRVASRGGVTLGEDARQALAAGARSWPGGVAELRDVVLAAGWCAWSRNAPGADGGPAVVGARDLGVELPPPGGAMDLSDERRG